MANELNTLFIRLEADTARLKRGMERADKITTSTMKKIRRQVKKAAQAFKNLGSTLGGVARKMGLIGAVGLAGLIFMTKKSLDAIDKIGKLSKTLGIATEDLATFELAAALGGSSLDTFARAARNVSKNVFDFVVKGTGEAVDVFKVLGITITDIKPIMNDQVAIMGLIGDKLNSLPDGAIKTALAVKLLGGRAAELLPALAGGSAQMEKFRKEAEILGIALSEKTVAGVERANDAMTRLGFLFRGGRDQLVGVFAPALEFVVDLIRNKMIEALDRNGLTVTEWARGIVISALKMTQAVTKAIGVFIGQSIVAFNSLSMLFDGPLIPESVFKSLERGTQNTIDNIQGMIVAIQTFSANTGLASDNSNILFGNLEKGLRGAKDQLADFAEKAKDGFVLWQDAGLKAVNSLEDALTDFVTTGKLSFSGLINSMIADIARLTIRQAITGPLAKILGAGIGNIFSGKAGGGAVQPGVPIEVGERGKELFIPNTTGRIVNAADTRNMGGQQTSITQNITIATDVKNTVRAEMFQLFPILEQQILNSVNQQFSGVRA